MKRIHALIQTGIAGSVLLLLAVTTKAQLPAPYAEWSVQVEDSTTPPYGEYDPGSSIGSFSLGLGGGSASLTLFLGLEPGLNASSSGIGPSYETAGGGVDVESFIYGFYVINLGGGSASTVPIILSATGTVTNSTSDYSANADADASSAQAYWGSLNSSGTSVSAIGANSSLWSATVTGVEPSLSSSSNVSGTISVSEGTNIIPYGIAMRATVSDNVGTGTAVASTASILAYVFIDPTFAQASNYQIMYATNVLPPPPPPFQPTLLIQPTTNGVTLLWPVTTPAFTLQQNSDLSTTNWVANTSPDNVVNGTNQVMISPATGNMLFRLISP
jgi:hypothetical protein